MSLYWIQLHTAISKLVYCSLCVTVILRTFSLQVRVNIIQNGLSKKEFNDNETEISRKGLSWCISSNCVTRTWHISTVFPGLFADRLLRDISKRAWATPKTYTISYSFGWQIASPSIPEVSGISATTLKNGGSTKS